MVTYNTFIYCLPGYDKTGIVNLFKIQEGNQIKENIIPIEPGTLEKTIRKHKGQKGCILLVIPKDRIKKNIEDLPLSEIELLSSGRIPVILFISDCLEEKDNNWWYSNMKHFEPYGFKNNFKQVVHGSCDKSTKIELLFNITTFQEEISTSDKEYFLDKFTKKIWNQRILKFLVLICIMTCIVVFTGNLFLVNNEEPNLTFENEAHSDVLKSVFSSFHLDFSANEKELGSSNWCSDVDKEISILRDKFENEVSNVTQQIEKDMKAIENELRESIEKEINQLQTRLEVVQNEAKQIEEDINNIGTKLVKDMEQEHIRLRESEETHIKNLHQVHTQEFQQIEERLKRRKEEEYQGRNVKSPLSNIARYIENITEYVKFWE